MHGGESAQGATWSARASTIRAGSMAGLAEEAPIAYKDVSQVVEVVHNAGIANKVARLRPIARGEGVGGSNQ